MTLNLPEKLSGYTQKQSDFLLAMLDCGIISEAAKRANVSEATAYKWLNDGLNKDLRNIRAGIIEGHLNKLQFATDKAVQCIIEILDDEKSSAGIKLKASQIILNTTLKLQENEQIVDRLEEIEKRMEQNER